MNNRLDLNRVDNSGIKRLIEAILIGAIRDWKKYSNEINKKGRKESSIRELKQILSFIKSDYFIALTNNSCPQKEIMDKLIATIKDNKIKKELKTYCNKLIK